MLFHRKNVTVCVSWQCRAFTISAVKPQPSDEEISEQQSSLTTEQAAPFSKGVLRSSYEVNLCFTLLFFSSRCRSLTPTRCLSPHGEVRFLSDNQRELEQESEAKWSERGSDHICDQPPVAPFHHHFFGLNWWEHMEDVFTKKSEDLRFFALELKKKTVIKKSSR